MDQIKTEIVTSHVIKVEPDDYDCDLVNSTVDQVDIKIEHKDGELIGKFEAEECDIQCIKTEILQDSFEIKDENIEVPSTSVLEFDKYNINQVAKISCNMFECKNVRDIQSNLKSPVNNLISIMAKNLKTKMECHSKQLTCAMCNYSTKYEVHLKRHILKEHKKATELNRFKCSDCDYFTKYKGNLKYHILSKHTKATFLSTWNCTKCNYSTTINRNLNRHMQNMHTKATELNTFKCLECDYSTKYKGSLKHHILFKHSAEFNRFKCFECEFSTKYKSHLNLHISRKHTKVTEINELKCAKCDFLTAFKSNFNRHMRSKHANKKK